MTEDPENTPPYSEGTVYELNYHERFKFIKDLHWLHAQPVYTMIHQQILHQNLNESIEISAFYDPITRDVNIDFKFLSQVLNYPSYTYHVVIVPKLFFDHIVFDSNILKKVSAIWHVEKVDSIRHFSMKKLCNISKLPHLKNDMKVIFNVTLSRSTRPYMNCTKHETLINHLIEIFACGQYSNVTLDAGDASFEVHRSIVRRFATFCERLNQACGLCSNVGCSFATHISPKYMKNLLYYIYTNELDIFSQMEVLELYNLALKLGIPELGLDCENILQHCMTPDNVSVILGFTFDNRLERMWAFAINFVFNHEVRVIVTPNFRKLLQSHPNMVIEVWKRLASYRVKSG